MSKKTAPPNPPVPPKIEHSISRDQLESYKNSSPKFVTPPPPPPPKKD